MSQSQRFINRVDEMIADGYVVKGSDGRLILTPKGWTVLLAYADRPITKPAVPQLTYKEHVVVAMRKHEARQRSERGEQSDE